MEGETTTASRPDPVTRRAPPARSIVLRIAVLLVACVWLERVCRSALSGGAESDVVRQWVVTQYVHHGEDPYEIANDLLDRRNDELRGSSRDARILPQLGPPVATYPPSSLALLSVSIGWLRSMEPVLWIWLAVNLFSLAAVFRLLGRTFDLPPALLPIPPGAALLLMLLAIVPTWNAIANGQFVLPVLACLLVVVQPAVSGSKAGLALGFALVKPSIALPFVVLEAARGRFKSIAIALGLHVIALGALSVALRRSPVLLIGEWMSVSEHYMAGMFTLQELINVAGLQGTLWSKAIVAAALALLAGVVLLFRRRPTLDLFAFLCAGSVVWMYHKYYDFVMVMPALLILMGWRRRDPAIESPRHLGRAPRFSTALATFLVVVSVAMIPYVNYADGGWARAMRWGGRLALVALPVVMLLRVVAPRGSLVAPGARR
jgi:glycosyl transferase family 87